MIRRKLFLKELISYLRGETINKKGIREFLEEELERQGIAEVILEGRNVVKVDGMKYNLN